MKEVGEGALLLFAGPVVCPHHALGPLPLDRPAVVVHVVVEVGRGRGHRKHARYVKVHICQKWRGQLLAERRSMRRVMRPKQMWKGWLH